MPGYEPFLLCDFHVHTRWSDGKLSVDLPAGKGVGEVWVYGLAKEVSVVVARGENRGRTVTYHNVA